MNALIRFSIKHCGFVALVSLLWLIIGLFLSFEAPLDVFPEFVPPQVTIQTEAPGLSPELVEQIITRPIESAVIGSPSISSVRSESVYGLSVVLITFDEDADPILSRQAVAERLTSLNGKLPLEAGSPKLTPLTSSTMDVVKIGLVSDTVDPYALRDFADWIVKPRLLAVSGIARVTVYGGAVRQIHIQPKIDRMTALGLTINDLNRAAKEALPLRGGGVIETTSQRVIIQTPPPLADPNAISETVVAVQNGLAIKIKDIAKVTFAPAFKVGDATIMGRPGVLITVSAKFGANTLLATKGVEDAMNDIAPLLEKKNIILYPSLHRPASFVVRSISNLEKALSLGSLLILIVLFLFLRNIRAALISFIAIPLSLLSTIVVLTTFGQTINTMTLGGFALALGVLVDDAIIDIENITRRLRLAEVAGRTDKLKVIEEASIEIRSSMFYGTLAIIFVFIPILFAGGVQGRFIGPMALTFIIAVATSMIVAITVTPALSALFLISQINTEEPKLLNVLKEKQSQALNYVQKSWRTTISILALGALLSAAVVPYLQSELIPQFREGHFVLQMSTAASGSSIDEVTELGERISNSLLELPFIDTVAHQIGRAEIGEDTWSPDRSEFHIELKPSHVETEEEAQNIIRATLENFPEVRSETLTFLGDRVSESLSGETAQVVINVIGANLDAIDEAASQIFSELAQIPGITDLRIPKSTKVPMLSVQINPQALARSFLT
ncbi:MAG: efflux RND transporter permease subunit, partial [Hyphomicrobium sp.]